MTARAHAAGRPVATPSQTVGPFFHFGLTSNALLGVVAREGTAGPRIRLRISVLDGDGAPVPDAVIELYQADAEGAYGRPPFPGFGRLPTGEGGTCTFDTIRPGRPDGGCGAVQAAHVHVCVLARGLLRHLLTRVYFEDDPALETDSVLALVPRERWQTLLARRADDEGTWAFTIRLQGEEETVFFDL